MERIRLAVDCLSWRARCPDASEKSTTVKTAIGGCSPRGDDSRPFVVHKANISSGGKVTAIELGDFLGAGKAGPEHQAGFRTIVSAAV